MEQNVFEKHDRWNKDSRVIIKRRGRKEMESPEVVSLGVCANVERWGGREGD